MSLQLFAHPYASFFEQVEKPTRYTGDEHGSVRKEWNSVTSRFCLAFPDIYDIGMSHLGFRILYKILNDQPDCLAERCYTPWVDMRDMLLSGGEFLRSLENARPLSDFDVVGFSLQYELTFTNILHMLDLGGIPLRAEHRGDADPLVIAGGPVATHSESVSIFFDAILIGDGEEAAVEIARSWTRDKHLGLSRKERLQNLCKIRGVYVPSLYQVEEDPETGFQVVTGTLYADAPLPIERRLLENLSDFPFPDDGPVGGPEAIFDRMSIEVARGCTEGCRFCQAGMIYRPVRERDPEQLLATVERAIEKSGHDEVSLTALSTADVSCISPLIKRLVESTAPRRISLSVASLRAYGLADDLLDDMKKVRATGLTFAPEAGTQRMRDVINKNVTEEQLMETAERVCTKGFDKMKLYFIIGLPTEEDDDVRGIIQVGRNALLVAKRLRRSRARVTVSVSSHVPKPHTPFQWAAMDSLEELRRKQQLLKEECSYVKGLNLRTHYSVTSVLEGILARGDRKMGYAIERAYLNGATFDSWDEHSRMDLWDEALDHFKVRRADYLGSLPIRARLPWDHFDIGLEEGFLAREYQKALKSRLSPPCGKVAGTFIHHTNSADAEQDQRKLVCYDCGIACDMTTMREQRIEYLEKLDAKTSDDRVRLPILGGAEEDEELDSSEEGTAKTLDAAHEGTEVSAEIPAENTRPAMFQQEKVSVTGAKMEAYRPPQLGEYSRHRIRLTKLGSVALLGHLDLMRELGRIVRRAGLRLKYSTGFNPKPELALGPALTLGAASLAEYMDIGLLDAPDVGAMLTALRDASIPGIYFTSVSKLKERSKSLNISIDQAEYLIVIPRAELGKDREIARLKLNQRIEAMMSIEDLKIRREHKGLARYVDVKKYLISIRSGDREESQLVREVGMVGDFETLRVSTIITEFGTVRPSEIVEALFGSPDTPYRLIRLGLSAEGEDIGMLGAATPPATAPMLSKFSLPTIAL